MQKSNPLQGARRRRQLNSEAVNVRIERRLLEFLDNWIAAQLDPKPTRPDAIRKLLAEKFDAVSPRPATTEAIENKIGTLEAKAAELKADGPPSPDKAMKVMRRAIVKNDIKKLKNRLVDAKTKRK